MSDLIKSKSTKQNINEKLEQTRKQFRDFSGEREEISSTNLGIKRIVSVLTLASFTSMLEHEKPFKVGGRELHRQIQGIEKSRVRWFCYWEKSKSSRNETSSEGFSQQVVGVYNT